MRLVELRKITEYLIENNKYLSFHEKKINIKKNELETLKLKLEDEEKDNFEKYKVKDF